MFLRLRLQLKKISKTT